MKKLILGLVAASTLATPALAHPFGGDDHGGYNGRGSFEQVRSDRDDHGRSFYQHRGWRRGDRFDARFVRNYREIRNPRFYRLREAPRGYRWVRSGNDAVLIALTSGIVAAVLANVVH